MKHQAILISLLIIVCCQGLNPLSQATFGEINTPTSLTENAATEASSAPPCNSDSPFRIDVLVVYTKKARSKAGGVKAIKTAIARAVAQTNQAYINSRVEQRLRLVHTAEIDYEENPALDMSNLKPSGDTGTSPAIRKQIKEWRDAYHADCIVVIVDYAGQDGPAGLTDPADAISIVDQVPATTKFTFAHELGHQMGAGHECGNPEADRAGIAHGFVSKTKQWCTIMATAAKRIPYFSNPNVTYRNEALGCINPHCKAAVPMLGQCQADNHQVLNQTALRIANLRCGKPSTKGVWLRDSWDDLGEEPAPKLAGKTLWNSPDLWLRKQQDKLDEVGYEYKNKYQHENPSSNRDQWVYAMLHNDSPKAATGTLELFYATGVTPNSSNSWKKIQSVKVADFAGFSTKVIELKWGKVDIPQTSHYHLLARWVSPDDPEKFKETGNLKEYVRQNNNVVWRKIK